MVNSRRISVRREKNVHFIVRLRSINEPKFHYQLSKMDEEIKELVKLYTSGTIGKTQFVSDIKEEIGRGLDDFKNWFQLIIQRKDNKELEFGLTILYAFEKENNCIDIVHQLILEPWHDRYEQLAHDLQARKKVESIPYLKEAMQCKFDFLESYSTGTRQFINQCGHALGSIGTEEAISVIRELSHSQDDILRDEMRYRLSKIEGRNDYVRNH